MPAGDRLLRPCPRQLRTVEGAREQVTETLGCLALASVEEHLRAGVLHEHLPAAPAGSQWPTVTGEDAERDEVAMAPSHERRDQAALGTEGEAKRSVLHIAANYDLAVPAQPGGTDAEPRVRGVGSACHLAGGSAEGEPINRDIGAIWARVRLRPANLFAPSHLRENTPRRQVTPGCREPRRRQALARGPPGRRPRQ